MGFYFTTSNRIFTTKKSKHSLSQNAHTQQSLTNCLHENIKYIAIDVYYHENRKEDLIDGGYY